MRKLQLEELNRLSVSDFRESKKVPVVLVLDNIRSGLNVGSAFRTADAFGLEKICLCGISARPPHKEILKTAIGATESVNWTYQQGITDCLSELKTKGYRILLVEQTDRSVPLQDLQWGFDKPLALVFGNEVHGISEAALSLADASLEIPQFGTKHSLNIAVCLGIVAWEAIRHYKWSKT